MSVRGKKGLLFSGKQEVCVFSHFCTFSLPRSLTLKLSLTFSFHPSFLSHSLTCYFPLQFSFSPLHHRFSFSTSPLSLLLLLLSPMLSLSLTRDRESTRGEKVALSFSLSTADSRVSDCPFLSHHGAGSCKILMWTKLR